MVVCVVEASDIGAALADAEDIVDGGDCNVMELPADAAAGASIPWERMAAMTLPATLTWARADTLGIDSTRRGR